MSRLWREELAAMVSCLCLCRRQDPGRLAELVVSACVPVLARLETAASPQQASPAWLLVLPALAVELCAGLFADRVPERESPSPDHAPLLSAAVQADASGAARPYSLWWVQWSRGPN